MKPVLLHLAAPLLALVACATEPAGSTPGATAAESDVEQSVLSATCIEGSVRACVGTFADSNAACDRDPTHQCVTRVAVSETESICICGLPE